MFSCRENKKGEKNIEENDEEKVENIDTLFCEGKFRETCCSSSFLRALNLRCF